MASSSHSSVKESVKESSTRTFDLFGRWKSSGAEGEGEAFLKEKVLEETKDDSPKQKEAAKESPIKQETNRGHVQDFLSLVNKVSPNEEDHVEGLLQRARDFASHGDAKTKDTNDLLVFQQELKTVQEQIKRSFEHVGMEKLNPMSLLYYVEREDSIKTPSWRRRKHRFLPSLEMTSVYTLNDALYLSELAYLDSIDAVKAGLDGMEDSPFELIYCTVDGKPREPAHFIALKKECVAKQEGFFPWQKETCLDVIMVVRGTKEVGDVLSDCLLDSSDYREGKGHDGITQAGKWLVDKHVALFEHLLQESKRKKIRLSLFGHSLGAGSAAIAAIEFNDHPNFEATCIGFGCPAMLDKALSEKTKAYITTVVADSDVVPRLSGASVANILLDVMAFDFSDTALEDVKQLLDVANENVSFGIVEGKRKDILAWVQGKLDTDVKPACAKVTQDRIEVVLFPPGKCVHLYRDGVGVSAVYVPCDFFNEIDVTRTLLNDHRTGPGYNGLLLEFVRLTNNDLYFKFNNEVKSIEYQIKKEEEEETEQQYQDG